MSAIFVNISFENKRLINKWTFTSSAFGITGDMLRNSSVGDVFALKFPATVLNICVFPAAAPILLCLIASITRSDLLFHSALRLLLLKRRVR